MWKKCIVVLFSNVPAVLQCFGKWRYFLFDPGRNHRRMAKSRIRKTGMRGQYAGRTEPGEGGAPEMRGRGIGGRTESCRGAAPGQHIKSETEKVHKMWRNQIPDKLDPQHFSGLSSKVFCMKYKFIGQVVCRQVGHVKMMKHRASKKCRHLCKWKCKHVQPTKIAV